MGTKGQVVIPKHVRERHGWGPGAEMSFEDQDDAVVIKRVDARRPLKGRFAHLGGDMAAELLKDRREDEARDRRREEHFGTPPAPGRASAG